MYWLYILISWFCTPLSSLLAMVFFFSQNKTSVNYTATHLFSVVYHMSALICVLDLRINVWWSEIHLWEFHCHIIVLWLYNFAAIQKKQKQAFPQALLCRIIMNFEREVCFAPSQRFDRKLIPKRNPTLDSHLKHGKCWQHRTQVLRQSRHHPAVNYK